MTNLIVAMRRFKLEPVAAVNRVSGALPNVSAMHCLSIRSCSFFDASQSHADSIMDYRVDSDPEVAWSDELVQSIDSLWHDPIIPTVLDRQSEFYLMDSAAYFFDEIQRIGQPDYVPNETDVLRARTKTTGISETKFKSGQLSIQFVKRAASVLLILHG